MKYSPKIIQSCLLVWLQVASSCFLFSAEVDKSIPLATAEEVVIPPSQKEAVSYEFSLDEAVKEGKQCRLVFDARLESKSNDGWQVCLWVRLKGTGFYNTTAADLLNKAPRFKTKSGKEFIWNEGGTMGLLFAPNFDTDRMLLSRYASPDPKFEPFHFAINLTSHLASGKNHIYFYNYRNEGEEIVLRNPTIEVGDPLPALPAEVPASP